MKNIKLWFGAVAILLVQGLYAQHYTLSDNNSEVKFKIKNFGVQVSGSFKGLAGTVHFEPARLSNSSFDASVESSTVNTGIGSRDNHLRKEEYFDVKKFGTITIKSTKIAPANKEGWLYFFGTLTLKGVSKEISFPFQATEKDGGFIFTGEFKINRRDYGVGSNSLILADNLTVNLSVFAKKS